ncbi:hypothetical protein Poli38472_000012 [Pythium oligandrum]|uniref:pyridoxal kinase n=1 Tax=Pythium oligandrum TaxID=41045 RepID=A0A8K1FDZ7_PYTOL|nr:hypothetical protein Poli38472_000012 [Pythium oligandrum]|eukprot:TMW59970.1 hypothetical protein Poli38472_000012 [Pythium oligandrum]
MATAHDDLALDAVEECHGRVLSIQSHVVQGYVGNKSAVFPMQLLGMEVDIINSVHFSNHSGYPSFGGKHLRLTGEDVLDLLNGLEANSLLKNAYTHLLTGYIGSPALLQAIIKVHERMKAAQDHDFLYVCDPVLGDNGRLYVASEMVDLYRSVVVPIADVLTPNQFECEMLTDMKLDTVADAIAACHKLHERGPSVVVISSFQERNADGLTNPEELVVIGSKKQAVDGEGAPTYEQFEIRLPMIDSYYTGTGDLFSALLLVWLHRLPNNFKLVLENVISTIQAVLKITLKLGGRNCELKLIQSRHVIANPTSRVTARSLLS